MGLGVYAKILSKKLVGGLIILCCAYFNPLQSSIFQFLCIHLGRQAITVLFEYKIHTPFGELGFFVIAAAALLFLIFSRTDRHPFPLTKINCCMRHYQFLSVTKIHSMPSNPWDPFWTFCSTRDRFSLKLPVTLSSHFSSSIPELPLFLISAKVYISWWRCSIYFTMW